MAHNLNDFRAIIDEELFNEKNHKEVIKNQVRNRLYSKRYTSNKVKKLPSILKSILSFTVLTVLFLGIVNFTLQEIRRGELEGANSNKTEGINKSNNATEALKNDETVGKKYKGYRFEIENLSIQTKLVKQGQERINVLEYRFSLKNIGDQIYTRSTQSEKDIKLGVWAKESLLNNMINKSKHEHPMSNMEIVNFKHSTNEEEIHFVTFQFKIKDGTSPEKALKEGYKLNILVYIGGKFIQSNGLEHYLKNQK